MLKKSTIFSRVKSLILHAENASKIKKNYKSRIIVHRSEAEYLRHGDSPLPKGTSLTIGFMTNALERVQSKYNYETTESDILVDEKCNLNTFGVNTYILHTPGHSKGSLSIIVDPEIAMVGRHVRSFWKFDISPLCRRYQGHGKKLEQTDSQ